MRRDLIDYAQAIIASLETPQMKAIVQTLAAEASRNAALDASRRQYWAARFTLGREIVTRAIARGELPRRTAPDPLIEAILGPIYRRLLVTGDPLRPAHANPMVDFALAAVSRGGNTLGPIGPRDG